jgi:hypothetical protein
LCYSGACLVFFANFVLGLTVSYPRKFCSLPRRRPCGGGAIPFLAVGYWSFAQRYSRSAATGLIATARNVGIKQAKVAARASTIMTNPIVTGS